MKLGVDFFFFLSKTENSSSEMDKSYIKYKKILSHIDHFFFFIVCTKDPTHFWKAQSLAAFQGVSHH